MKQVVRESQSSPPDVELSLSITPSDINLSDLLQQAHIYDVTDIIQNGIATSAFTASPIPSTGNNYITFLNNTVNTWFTVKNTEAALVPGGIHIERGACNKISHAIPYDPSKLCYYVSLGKDVNFTQVVELLTRVGANLHSLGEVASKITYDESEDQRNLSTTSSHLSMKGVNHYLRKQAVFTSGSEHDVTYGIYNGDDIIRFTVGSALSMDNFKSYVSQYRGLWSEFDYYKSIADTVSMDDLKTILYKRGHDYNEPSVVTPIVKIYYIDDDDYIGPDFYRVQVDMGKTVTVALLKQKEDKSLKNLHRESGMTATAVIDTLLANGFLDCIGKGEASMAQPAPFNKNSSSNSNTPLPVQSNSDVTISLSRPQVAAQTYDVVQAKRVANQNGDNNQCITQLLMSLKNPEFIEAVKILQGVDNDNTPESKAQQVAEDDRCTDGMDVEVYVVVKNLTENAQDLDNSHQELLDASASLFYFVKEGNEVAVEYISDSSVQSFYLLPATSNDGLSAVTTTLPVGYIDASIKRHKAAMEKYIELLTRKEELSRHLDNLSQKFPSAVSFEASNYAKNGSKKPPIEGLVVSMYRHVLRNNGLTRSLVDAHYQLNAKINKFSNSYETSSVNSEAIDKLQSSIDVLDKKVASQHSMIEREKDSILNELNILKGERDSLKSSISGASEERLAEIESNVEILNKSMAERQEEYRTLTQEQKSLRELTEENIKETQEKVEALVNGMTGPRASLEEQDSQPQLTDEEKKRLQEERQELLRTMKEGLEKLKEENNSMEYDIKHDREIQFQKIREDNKSSNLHADIKSIERLGNEKNQIGKYMGQVVTKKEWLGMKEDFKDF